MSHDICIFARPGTQKYHVAGQWVKNFHPPFLPASPVFVEMNWS